MKDFKKMGYDPYLISGKTGEGVETLIEARFQGPPSPFQMQ